MFEVEPVQRGDLRSVMRLAWKTSSPPLPYGFFERVAARQPEYFRIVRGVDGHPVAFIVAARKFGIAGNVLLLAVDPSYQNQGLRRALLAEIQRRLVAEGERNFTVEIPLRDRESIGFYEHQGFHVVGVEPGDLGPQADRVVLSKPITK